MSTIALQLTATVAILSLAYIAWDVVNETMDHSRKIAMPFRRLQSGIKEQTFVTKQYRLYADRNGEKFVRKRKQEFYRNRGKRKRKKNKNKNKNNGQNTNTGSNGGSSSNGGIAKIGYNKWRRSGDQSGLKLTVLNNLDANSVWNTPLRASSNEWNSGSAVSLKLRRVTYDSGCEAVPLAIKICNDNYGPVEWKGLNQVYLQNEDMVASIAKLNDYYLKGMDYVEKQYTLCHEIGHGLGLKHTDEDFTNKDLGNCMDYTNKHSNNVHPGAVNLNLLKAVYGVVGGRRLIGESPMSDEEKRLFVGALKKHSTYSFDAYVVSSQSGVVHSPHGRLLRRTDSAEFYEKNLGNGYSVRTTVLLA